MVFRAHTKSLMRLKRWQSDLLLQEIPGLFPCTFSLISFIDDIVTDWQFFIINEYF